MKMKITKKKILIIVSSILLVLAGTTFVVMKNAVRKNHPIEIGESFDVQELNRLPFGELEWSGAYVWEELPLGEYKLTVKHLFGSYDVMITVQDTISPVAEGLEIQTNPLKELKPEECIENVEDATRVSYAFKEEIDYSLEDVQHIIILLEDEGGNITEINSKITVIQDTTPPVIECQDSYRYELNATISYKQLVTVTDDREEEVEIDIDNSDVNTKKVGTYTVIYTATDFAGHVTVKKVSIEIYDPTVVSTSSTSSSSSSSSNSSSSSSSSSSSQTVEEKAQAVLSSIITSGMSQTQKAKAIYTWCYTKISYNGVNSASSWTAAANQGLTSKAGNCYTYASTARMLLTQAGITNMSISSPNHHWNLVNVGNGWYHFDSTYCSDKVQIFMWTDAELTAYYEKGYRARHNYTKSNYPTIN